MDTTILVIEESLDLCRLFEYMLRADGHTVFSFNDWHAARPALIAYAPDLIIFDWSIANMAGYRWAESLRRAPDTAHIPILFVCSDPPSRATSEMPNNTEPVMFMSARICFGNRSLNRKAEKIRIVPDQPSVETSQSGS